MFVESCLDLFPAATTLRGRLIAQTCREVILMSMLVRLPPSHIVQNDPLGKMSKHNIGATKLLPILSWGFHVKKKMFPKGSESLAPPPSRRDGRIARDHLSLGLLRIIHYG